MRSVRFVCVFAILVGGPAVASADPPPNDPWYYNAWLDQTPGPNGGAGDLRHDVLNAGPGWYLPGTSPRPDFVAVWLRPGFPAVPHWEPGTSIIVGDETRFALNVRFNDAATGDNETVTVTGTAHSDWMKRWDGRVDPDQAWVAFDPGTWTATVGGTKFTITTRDEYVPIHDGRFGRITGGLQLTATPVTAHAPEPGTLALAAVGLLPVVGLYRRRKS